MGAEMHIGGGYERLPAPLVPEVVPGRERPSEPLPAERVGPVRALHGTVRPSAHRTQAPSPRPHGPRDRAADAGPRASALTAWPGSFGPGPLARAGAPFLAQQIAQEVLAEGVRIGPRLAAANLYRLAAAAGVTILGPEVSVDISV